MESILCYRTEAHDCGYFADRQAVTLVVDPSIAVTQQFFSDCMRLGFRRQGFQIYRPHCGSCSACISVRIPVDAFSPNRTQRKVLKQHLDLKAEFVEMKLRDEQFSLFKRYQSLRHHDANSPYLEHELEAWYYSLVMETPVKTYLVEFRDASQQLVMMSAIDQLDDGLSAFYTFFDPEMSARSFGTYSILWQIEMARRWRLSYVYLGYWIADCRKMSYKQNFQRLEYWNGLTWSHEIPKFSPRNEA